MSDPIVLKMEATRDALGRGKLGEAVGYLGDAAGGTRDSQLLLEMREMAEEGLERSGRFSKGEWKRIVKTLDKKLAAVAPERQMASVSK